MRHPTGAGWAKRSSGPAWAPCVAARPLALAISHTGLLEQTMGRPGLDEPVVGSDQAEPARSGNDERISREYPVAENCRTRNVMLQ